jgi:mannose-6-phosphate isomerase-like protein (cupin superfamily)
MISMDNSNYNIDYDIKYPPLTKIDIPSIIDTMNKSWQNQTLAQVNECVVRLGVIHGEFHWHRHDAEDEFFYVISGLLQIDLEEKSIELTPGQGYVIPRGINHRTRAPERTAILMVEGSTVSAIGD